MIFLQNFILERNAVLPFIVDLPSKIYNESTINMDVMFTFCSAVSIMVTICHMFIVQAES